MSYDMMVRAITQEKKAITCWHGSDKLVTEVFCNIKYNNEGDTINKVSEGALTVILRLYPIILMDLQRCW